MDNITESPGASASGSLGSRLVVEGFVHVAAPHFAIAGGDDDLGLLQESYFRLPIDRAPGCRRRAYSRFALVDGRLVRSSSRGYSQSPEYNYVDGGKTRHFADIEPEIRNGRMLGHLILLDLEIVRKSGLVAFDAPIRIGVHQIRYRPVGCVPAFSSPPWLHRDDETIVFVHLVNLSSNIIGGDNVIATGDRTFESVVRLESPLDTLGLTRLKKHAVTPVAVRGDGAGYRDVMLVTVESESDVSEIPIGLD